MSGAKWWEKTFSDGGTFAAMGAAREWLKRNGYSLGGMQGYDPMGILLGDYDIAKWRNLRPAEKAGLDGQLEGDKRNGPVVVRLKAAPATEVP